jgi:hypothetical protein
MRLQCADFGGAGHHRSFSIALKSIARTSIHRILKGGIWFCLRSPRVPSSVLLGPPATFWASSTWRTNQTNDQQAPQPAKMLGMLQSICWVCHPGSPIIGAATELLVMKLQYFAPRARPQGAQRPKGGGAPAALVLLCAACPSLSSISSFSASELLNEHSYTFLHILTQIYNALTMVLGGQGPSGHSLHRLRLELAAG